MRIAYFDCFSGISGDMLLGALVDAGADLSRLESELRRLNLPGWKISAEKVRRGALAATQVHVRVEGQSPRKHGPSHRHKHAATHGHAHGQSHAHEHGHSHGRSGHSHPTHEHRALSEILRLIDAAQLPPRAADRARKIFVRLGEAEAKVHAIPREKVHFHEVGAVDSIVDIVGAAIGFELLGVDEFACSRLNLGAGSVETEHGILPVPAPATVELLRRAPTYSTGIQKELVTPTGAAIVSTLVTRFDQIPPMKLEAIGYGAGSADLAEQPNVLRLLLGDALEAQPGEAFSSADSSVCVIETNLDDMSPQIYGYFAEQALAAGALDVYSTAVQMKKNRPGQLVTILCAPTNANRLTDLIFRETTTIGVRMWEARRRCLEREIVSVATPYGEVRVKVSRLNGTVQNAAPEYEDCRRIAAEKGVPLKEIMAAAAFYFQKREARG